MFEILLLVIISVLIGSAVFEKGGWSSIHILVALLLIGEITQGGKIGLIFGLTGLVIMFVVHFISQKNTSKGIYTIKSKTREEPEPAWAKDVRESFQKGMEKKYGKYPSTEFKGKSAD